MPTTFTKESRPVTTFTKESRPDDESFLLMEDGFILLLETDDKILLETQGSGTVYTKETKP